MFLLFLRDDNKKNGEEMIKVQKLVKVNMRKNLLFDKKGDCRDESWCYLKKNDNIKKKERRDCKALEVTFLRLNRFLRKK